RSDQLLDRSGFRRVRPDRPAVWNLSRRAGGQAGPDRSHPLRIIETMTSKFIAVLIICALSAPAQDKNFFPKPSYFRETFSAPNSHIELRPPARLADFVVDGKLELSLRAFVELVMANNTDVAI